MTLADLDEVYEIETAAHITPWSKSIIHDCITVGYGCFVLEERKKNRIKAFSIVRVAGGGARGRRDARKATARSVCFVIACLSHLYTVNTASSTAHIVRRSRTYRSLSHISARSINSTPPRASHS